MFRVQRHAIKRRLRRLLRIPPEERLFVDSDLFYRYALHRLPSDAVYVEIGAGTGTTAAMGKRLLNLVPSRCHLVEACPTNFALLQTKMPGFKIYNYAVTDRSGEVYLNVIDKPTFDGSSRSNSIDERALRVKTSLPIRRIVVPSITMDGLFHEAGIKRCDFLYMNCEGAEYTILRGDTSFLRRVFLFRFDLHKGLYGDAQSEQEMVGAKVAIYDLLECAGFVRIGGHSRKHIEGISGVHLTSFWENERLSGTDQGKRNLESAAETP